MLYMGCGCLCHSQHMEPWVFPKVSSSLSNQEASLSTHIHIQRGIYVCAHGTTQSMSQEKRILDTDTWKGNGCSEGDSVTAPLSASAVGHDLHPSQASRNQSLVTPTQKIRMWVALCLSYHNACLVFTQHTVKLKIQSTIYKSLSFWQEVNISLEVHQPSANLRVGSDNRLRKQGRCPPHPGVQSPGDKCAIVTPILHTCSGSLQRNSSVVGK